MKISGKGLALW